ncbi:InsB, second part of transposase, partial (plasmid) [Escherichia coli]
HRHPDFKKLAPKRITSSPVAHADVALICELDEQWSYVGSKARQHWLWYAYNIKTGGVLAYTFGSQIDQTCRELLALLTPFNIGMLTSDDWGSYGREVPKNKHLTGKIFTQRIERNNLTLRTRIKRLARKTICFSRSVKIHEKVIGAFIEKHMFY